MVLGALSTMSDPPKPVSEVTADSDHLSGACARTYLYGGASGDVRDLFHSLKITSGQCLNNCKRLTNEVKEFCSEITQVSIQVDATKTASLATDSRVTRLERAQSDSKPD